MAQNPDNESHQDVKSMDAYDGSEGADLRKQDMLSSQDLLRDGRHDSPRPFEDLAGVGIGASSEAASTHRRTEKSSEDHASTQGQASQSGRAGPEATSRAQAETRRGSEVAEQEKAKEGNRDVADCDTDAGEHSHTPRSAGEEEGHDM